MTLRGTSYETPEEVAFRLNKTVVLYDGEPVYITRTEVSERPNDVSRVYFRTLPLVIGQPEVRKYLSSRKFDLTPIKLGYFYNKKDGLVVRAVREAARHTKQGLNGTNCRFKSLTNRELRYSFEGFLSDDLFVAMLKGESRSLRGRKEFVEGEEHLFDSTDYVLTKDFVVSRECILETDTYIYKNDIIAVIPQSCTTLTLPKAFSFLQEEVALAGLY